MPKKKQNIKQTANNKQPAKVSDKIRNIDIKFNVDTTQLDVAIEKMSLLIEKFKEANSLSEKWL